MVSALWKACAEGDLEKVHQLLKDASTLDIEIRGKYTRSSVKPYLLSGDPFNILQFTTQLIIHSFFLVDHTGVTPLIEAIKNGHVEVVKALLDKGSLIRLTLTYLLINL
jgi:ankyrin repeat protein